MNVEVPEPLTDVGLNEALVCLGTPLTLKLTLDENGPSGATETVNVVLEPRLTVALPGDTAREKSATTNVTWVE